jgi:RES domain-containing protein
MAESLANYEDYGIPISQAMPLVFVAVKIRLQSVLDITVPQFLRPLGLKIDDLTQIGWRAEQGTDQEPLTQAIGRLAYEAKLEAILVPSSRARGDLNVVYFPQRRRAGSSIKIQGVRDLPKK